MSSKQDNARTVLLQGDRTVRHAAELSALLHDVSTGAGDVVLSFEGITAIDTSAICSILALKHALHAQGRSMAFHFPQHTEVAVLLERTGMRRFILKY